MPFGFVKQHRKPRGQWDLDVYVSHFKRKRTLRVEKSDIGAYSRNPPEAIQGSFSFLLSAMSASLLVATSNLPAGSVLLAWSALLDAIHQELEKGLRQLIDWMQH